MNMTLTQLLAAERDDRNIGDAEITLSKAIIAERDRLEAALRAAETAHPKRASLKNEEADQIRAELVDLRNASADAILLLRFREIPAEAWAAIASIYPPNLASEFDKHYGYNVAKVARAAAEWVSPDGEIYGGRLVDGELVPLVIDDEDGNPSEDPWGQLFGALGTANLEMLTRTIFHINVRQGELDRASMLKSFGAAARSGK